MKVFPIGVATIILAMMLSWRHEVSAANMTLTLALNTFSENLYKGVHTKSPNLVFSPYSIHSVLTMTSFGANGDTALAMKSALCLDDSTLSDPHLAYQTWNSKLNSETAVKLDCANAIYVQPNFNIRQSYETAVSTYYKALSKSLDFSAEGGPQKPINDWVANKTNGMIQNLIPAGTITKETVMLLINTIFFKGHWVHAFPESKTKDADFTSEDGSVKKVQLMHHTHHYNYKSHDELNADILEVPFRGGHFSLGIVLPKTTGTLRALENTLMTQAGAMSKLFEGLESTSVDLFLPKFKVETSLGLKEVLMKLGMGVAFSDAADFTGITADGNIQISDVLHKAVIEVTEKGTTASAATAVIMNRMMAMPLPTPAVTFRADRPFLFFLRDTTTGGVLFQGKLCKPT